MSIIDKVRNTINKYSMLSQWNHVLVALSGGPDSACLLTVLNALKSEFNIHLHAAYIDHGLRPLETPREIESCKKLCASLGIPFTTGYIDVKSYAKEKKLNKQEAARELRYNALNEIAAEKTADRIALGHNANDQAETVLMRLIRGTGSAGLSGMPPIRSQKSGIGGQKVDLIRPLIEIERHEIEDFLKREGIGFMIDSSNMKHEYSRNKIRHLVIPAIRDINTDVIHTLSRTADIFRDEERYFEILATKTLMRLITRKTSNTIELFLSPMETMDTVILRRTLRRAIEETRGIRGIGFIHIEDIINLVKHGKSGNRLYLPNGRRVIKGYSTLIITSEKPAKLGTCIVDSPGEIALKEPSMVIHSRIIGIDEMEDYGDGGKSAAIDADKVHFPMIIRARLPGDFFYPYGFGKRKKLQDYLVDEKIPRDERDTVPLLTCGNNIVWVMGHRLDDRYKVDKKTKRVLKLEIKPLKT